MARSSMARKARIRLRPPKKSGRPCKVAGPERLQKDALAIVLQRLHELGLFHPTGKSVGAYVELLIHPDTETVAEMRGDRIMTSLIGPEDLPAALDNLARYTAQRVAGSSKSKDGYTDEEAEFIIGSTEIIIQIFLAQHVYIAKFLGTRLTDQFGWPAVIAERIVDSAILSRLGNRLPNMAGIDPKPESGEKTVP